MDKIKDFEQNLIEINCLLEVLKDYCQYKSEESEELSTISVLLDIISLKQDAACKKFDKIYLESIL